MKTDTKFESLRDESAAEALNARAVIEEAVDAGFLPVWVLEACDEMERAAMMYGAARNKLDPEAYREWYVDIYSREEHA